MLPRVRAALPLLGRWVALALALSALTTRVTDWFVMTDELLYEKLGTGVWQVGSPLPHVHGESIPNLNQLYPLLLAPLFRHGLVPASLHDAHALNAWVMSSACIPAYFLALRVTGRALVAYPLALLTVCLPWIVVSSFLLTEVAGYPAFLWAVLAIHAAVASPSRRNDVLALLAIALAVFARTQFELLLVVLPLAIVAFELGRGGLRGAWRRHLVLTVAYAVLVLGAVVLAALGLFSRVVGTYRGALEGRLVPDGMGRSLTEHLATLALGLGILPFVVGTAWLLANAVRPRSRELHAFACVASLAIAATALEVTVFDLRFGDGAVRDRYLFYVAPLVLLGFLCALVDTRWPRWSLLAPATLVTLGFALDHLPAYGIFHADSPVAVLHDWLRSAFGSLNGARAFLAAATVLATLLFVALSRTVPRRYLAPALAVLTLVALPLETANAFARLFAHDGTSGRPVSLPQGVVFNWIDRTIGPDAKVTIVPYPSLPGEYFASVGMWWDLEFWNRSVVRAAHRPGEFEWTPSTFPKLYLRFDPRTGRANVSPTRYVAQSDKETRFRISGNAISNTRGAILTEAELPWRTDFLTLGAYDDGWTRPRVPATVRVFAEPGQGRPALRTISLGLRAPADVPSRPFTLDTNLASQAGTATNGATAYRLINVCVPATGYADVRVATPDFSPIYGDMRNQDTIGEHRDGGVLLVQVAVSDELGDACTPAR